MTWTPSSPWPNASQSWSTAAPSPRARRTPSAPTQRCGAPTLATKAWRYEEALMLKLEGIETYYGASQVLFGVCLEVGAGEVITLMGRNGMGKTTTVRSITGLTPAATGSIRFRNREVRSLASHRIAKQGLGLVPEGRQVFPNLSVRENLLATAANRDGRSNPWTLQRVFELFPRLQERTSSM